MPLPKNRTGPVVVSDEAGQNNDLLAGAIKPDSTESRRARDLDRRIDQALGDTFELLAEAFRTGAWVELGHESWAAYLATKAEIASLRIPAAERAEVFGRFRDAGMSNRQIAAAVGVSSRTVDRALPAASNVAEVDQEAINEVMSTALATVADSLLQAWAGHAEIALGYPTWNAYVDHCLLTPNSDLRQFAEFGRALGRTRAGLYSARGFLDFDAYCRERVPFITGANISRLIEISAFLDKTRAA